MHACQQVIMHGWFVTHEHVIMGVCEAAGSWRDHGVCVCVCVCVCEAAGWRHDHWSWEQRTFHASGTTQWQLRVIG